MNAPLDTIVRPVPILLGVLLATAPGLVFGAMVFGVLTVLLIAAFGHDYAAGRGIVLAILATSILFLAIPLTRSFAIGFLSALVLLSIPGRGFFTQVWWIPVDHAVGRATYRLRQEITARRKKREWLAVRRAERELDVHSAIQRARQLQQACVRLARAGQFAERLPSAMEVTEPDDCRDFRRDAFDIDAKYPARYALASDPGWRWTLSSSPVPSRWGGQGFLLTFRPDPLLARDGPVVELDAADLLRIRESRDKPATIVSTPVPAMQRLRACLLKAGSLLPVADLHRWRFLATSTEMRRACPEIRITNPGSTEENDERLELSFSEPPAAGRYIARAYQMRYRVLDNGRFELRAAQRFRRYLLSADGRPHVTTDDRDAESTDAAPLPCESDPSVPCG